MRRIKADDAPGAALLAAQLLADRLTRMVEQNGRASVAFSGGSSPLLMFKALASLPVTWEATHVFQVDERVAPDGSPARNWTDLHHLLLAPAQVPPENRHPMGVTSEPLADAAAEYRAVLVEKTNGVIDVVHLGLGDDGHTASWPPGDPVISSTTDVAVVAPYRGFQRMTLTPQAVNRAGQVVWLVTGKDKSDALASLDSRDAAIPASAVRRAEADVVVTDVQF
jgi:6-phosphogluconolactonase